MTTSCCFHYTVAIMSAFRLQFKLLFDKKPPIEFWLWGLSFGLVFSAACFLLIFSYHYRNRFYQGLRVEGFELGGLTQEEAEGLIKQNYQQPTLNSKLIITAADREGEEYKQTIDLGEVVGAPMFDQALEEAYQVGRKGSLFERTRVIVGLLSEEAHIQLRHQINEEVVNGALQELEQEINYPGEKPSIILATSGSPNSLIIGAGEDGWELLTKKSKTQTVEVIEELLFPAKNYINNSRNKERLPDQIEVKAIAQPIQLELSETEIERATIRALAYVGKSITFSPEVDSEFKEEAFLLANVERRLDDQQLVELLSPPNGFNKDLIDELMASWAEDIDQPAINAEFEYNPDTLAATAFSPHEPGLELDQELVKSKLVEQMVEFEVEAGVDGAEAALEDELKTEELQEKNGLRVELGSRLKEWFNVVDSEESDERSNEEDSGEEIGEKLDQESTAEAESEEIEALDLHNEAEFENEEANEGTNEGVKEVGEEPPPPNRELELVIHQTDPKVTLAETNDLGIEELLGFGESFYRGSIAPRLHNIGVASEKLSMTIIPPGKKFSFNQVVGRIDGSTGYRQAYVIRSGRTLMEFGGGVCQVSTTMFRAMLDAGVNITRRLPHSYRVRYYEIDNQPGFDATVYSGDVDLRFINDTPGHILIIAEADSVQAYMNIRIYGTNDNRTVEIENYKQWGYTSPPPAEDIPDPSLAPGERRQVENAIPGLKTSFDWVVYDAESEVMHEKTFFSHYRAWGAKFLVGI